MESKHTIKQRQWFKRMMGAMAGTSILPEMPPAFEYEIDEMYGALDSLPEVLFGAYAFSREPLCGRLSASEQYTWTCRAINCGREQAIALNVAYGTKDPSALAQKMGIKTFERERPEKGARILFAQFVEPDEITVFSDCLHRLAAEKAERSLPLEVQTVKNILLAHELFHTVETRTPGILTVQRHLSLWKLLGYDYRSSIQCLSEIAAMAFAAELMEIFWSPYILDPILVNLYNRQAGAQLFAQIQRLTESWTPLLNKTQSNL